MRTAYRKIFMPADAKSSGGLDDRLAEVVTIFLSFA